MNMDATHPVRVVLFWDLKHVKDTYGPYFTDRQRKVGLLYEYMNNDDEMRYLWTIILNIPKEGIHVLVEFEPIQSQTFSECQHTNISNIPEYVTAITQMVSHELSMFYPSVDDDDDDDDDDNDDTDKDYAISRESDDDNNPDDEENDISTPVNPVISTTVNQ
ncbi:hypothetical protein M9H77_28354 [Catharanthus roseus]|uniref:Uncharacterized protein n=1 Tax=Catharanthus roseus TaxID=4058 RepID=A0ACC0AFQ2_CATRO|nr:hypothetical protein M9H77_28354 [Catharanthus roseus]